MHTIKLDQEAFNTKQASQLTGASQRQIRTWDQKGLAKPSHKQAAGKGSRRLYSYADLIAIGAIKGLRDQGISLQKIRKCVLYLRKHLPDISQPFGFCTLLNDGQAIYLLEDEQTLIDVSKNQGQHVFIQINIAAIDHQIRNHVFKMNTRRIEEVIVGDCAYQVQIEPDEDCGGFVGEVAGLKGCITDGDTIEEVLANAQDAIACWLKAHDELANEGIEIPIEHSSTRRKKA